MALKKVLSKLSEFSLKSKVGLTVTAALVGLLSWSVVNKYFVGEEEPTRRPPPMAKHGESKSKSDEADDENAAPPDNEGIPQPENGMGLAAGSKLLNSMGNNSTETGMQSTPADSAAGGVSDRYAGYGLDNNAFGAGTQIAGGEPDTNAPSSMGGDGNKNLLDKYRQDSASGYGDYRNGNSTGVETPENSPTGANDPYASARAFGGSPSAEPAENTIGSNGAEDAAGTVPRYGTPSNGLPGYGSQGTATQGGISGSPVAKLDRSTPALDRSAPANNASAPRAFDNGKIADGPSQFRTGRDVWSSQSTASANANSGSDFATDAFGQPVNRGSTQNTEAVRSATHADPFAAEQNLYPRYPGSSVSAESTVSAGGNRRMAPINSTPPPEPQQQAASMAFDRPSPPANTLNPSTSQAAQMQPLGQNTTSQNAAAPPTQPDQEFVAGHEDSFWTISKQAYGEGGYYAALHAYNSQTIARIDGLRVGDVVRAPARATLHKLYPDKCPAPQQQTSPAGVDRTEHKAGLSQPEDATTNAITQTGALVDTTEDSEVSVYVTKEGEDLFQVAREQLGSAARWDEIYRLNQSLLGDNLGDLPAGTRLRLPKGTNVTDSGAGT